MCHPSNMKNDYFQIIAPKCLLVNMKDKTYSRFAIHVISTYNFLYGEQHQNFRKNIFILKSVFM